MRSTLPPLFLLTLASASGATSKPEEWWQRCGGPFQLCGYVERGSEEERIPKRFEIAKPFSDGLAAVRIDGLYGYIDPAGKVVIDPQFEAAGPFTGEYAEVQVGGRSGAIDRTGRIVVPAEFDRLIPFTGGAFIAKPLAAGAQRSSEQPRLDGEVRLEALSNLMSGLGRAGIYHIDKEWLTAADLGFSYFDEPARGLIWAGRANEHYDMQWGLLRSDGGWQVTPRFGHVQTLRETHAVVGSMPDYSLHPRERPFPLRGAVDRDGKLVVPLQFTGLSYWRGGYGYGTGPKRSAVVDTIGKAIVLSDGALLADRYFDEVDIREDGKLPRGRIGNVWYSIEADGRLVPDQLDGSTRLECDSGLKVVRRGDAVEFLRPGDRKSVGKFDDTYFTQRDCPGPFAVRRNEKWFYVNEVGAVLGGKTGFDSSHYFSRDYAAVQIGGKWGIIDRTGKFTVEPQFRKLRPGALDKFVVGEGKKTAWIDGKGRWIKAPEFKKPPPAEALLCEGGLRFFSADGLWGLQDGEGETVIEPRYRALSCFRQGVSWTAEQGSKEWCQIGPKGERRDAMKCREAHYPMIVTHHYPESFSENRHESSVLWVRAYLDYLAGRRAEAPRWISDFDDGPPASYSVIPN